MYYTCPEEWFSWRCSAIATTSSTSSWRCSRVQKSKTEDTKIKDLWLRLCLLVFWCSFFIGSVCLPLFKAWLHLAHRMCTIFKYFLHLGEFVEIWKAILQLPALKNCSGADVPPRKPHHLLLPEKEQWIRNGKRGNISSLVTLKCVLAPDSRWLAQPLSLSWFPEAFPSSVSPSPCQDPSKGVLSSRKGVTIRSQ